MDDQAQTLREMMSSRALAPALAETTLSAFPKKGSIMVQAPMGHTNLNNGAKANGRKKTRIITVASGKGGVGKTNVAINLAISYARSGKSVVVMDADLGLANVNVMLNIIPKHNLFHVIKRQKTLEEIIIDTEYGIKIIAGASGLSRIANLGLEERLWFIEQLENLSSYDILIIDSAAGISDNVMGFLGIADDPLIITTPEPTAITDAYGMLKIISIDMENQGLTPKLVVNRAKSITQARKIADRIISIAGQFLNLKAEYLGCIYEDPLVGESVLKQKPFIFQDPKSKASVSITHLMTRIERIEKTNDRSLDRLLKRWF